MSILHFIFISEPKYHPYKNKITMHSLNVASALLTINMSVMGHNEHRDA